MERRLNVTEARSQLPTLVKEVANGDHRIVISTRNEPKAIIMGYDAFLHQQELSTKGAHYQLQELIEQAKSLLETTLIECRGSGEPTLYLFWSHFGRLMRNAWEIYKEFSRPHASIAFQLFELSERCLAGDTMLEIGQLRPVVKVLTMLTQNELTMEDAAEADRYLLRNDIDARFPVYIEADLNALYEIDQDVDDYIDEVENL